MEPRLLVNVPPDREGREIAPSLVGTELGATVSAHREVSHILALIGIVCRISEIDAPPLSATSIDTIDDARSSRAGDGSRRKSPNDSSLRSVVSVREASW